MSALNVLNEDEKMQDMAEWKLWHREERTVEEQIASLTSDQLEAFRNLKMKWEQKEEKLVEFNDFMILRFIRNSPGKEKFNVDAAWKVMLNYEKWSLSWGVSSLRISDVRS
jgi:hypothetical protein